MSDKAQKTIRIKWVRSGIGFNFRQKRIVRSLGLKKLNQEIEKPDTAQIRGLVAKVPHLVRIVEAAAKPAWMSVPEYTLYPPQPEPSGQAGTAAETPAGEAEGAEAAVAEVGAAPAQPSGLEPRGSAPASSQGASDASGATAAGPMEAKKEEHAGKGEDAAANTEKADDPAGRKL